MKSQLKPVAGFLIRSVTAGLALAFVLIFAWPALRERLVPAPQTPVQPQRVAPTSYADAVDLTAPSVVSIYTRRMDVLEINPQLQRILRRQYVARERQDMGSGVLVSDDGYILTNNHVVAQVTNIQVALWDGRFSPARVVGSDPETDLAVLKIELEGLPAAPLATDAEVRVGDVVLAIGNALGLSHTVTMGIVSATGRDDLRSILYEDFIQTDAAINAGNSGGALVNAHGEVIGINTRKLGGVLGGQNIGFAIPIGLASQVMEQIIEYGSVQRGWMGVRFSNAPLSLQADGSAVRLGIQVAQLSHGGPAWSAGIREGDILLSLDGEVIDDARVFVLTIAQHAPGTKIELDVMRDQEQFATYMTLIQQPPLR